MLSDAKKDIDIANNHTFNALLDYLTKKANLKNLARPERIIERTGLNMSSTSHFPSDYNDFMRDKEFENLIDFHALNFNYLIGEYVKIKEYLEHNLKLLEVQINED